MPTDLADLALRARTALADARTVTLLIQGVGRVTADSPTVLLHDKEGLPMFLCEPGSPVSPAARRGCAAMLSVAAPRVADDDLTVLVCGQLCRQGAEDVDGVLVDVIALQLRTVVVELDEGGHGIVQYEVPLELYRRATPDTMRCYAARILHHTNDAHQTQLRRCVARRNGMLFDHVLAASLAAVDALGAQLHWVGEEGAHTMSLRFPRPARDAADLAAMLREGIARPGRWV